MTEPRHKLLLCNCNRTMQFDGKSVAGALGLGAGPHIHSELCRRHVAAFEAAAKSGDDLLVACTQEAPLFRELHEQFQAAGGIRFANIRETAGWSADSSRGRAENCSVAGGSGFAGARAGAGGVLPVARSAADHRPGGSRAAVGRQSGRAIAGQRIDRKRRRPRRFAARAPLSGVFRTQRQGSPVIWARSRSRGSRTIRSISRPARAAMRALRRAPSTRSITATRSISTNARRTGNA